VRKADGSFSKVTVVSPTRHSVECAVNGCRLLAAMSCDSVTREFVANDGISTVLHVMKWCHEEAVVQQFGCLALYNFVYVKRPLLLLLLLLLLARSSRCCS